MLTLLSSHSVAIALSFTLFLAAPARAQITVGPAGSGATYTQVTAALAVAVPGDTILVAAGTYAPFLINQGVSVIGAGSAVCQVQIPVGSPDGAMTVAQVPAGQTARIAGVGITTNSSSPPARIAITQCAGRVELIDIASLGVFGSTPRFVDHAVMEIFDSAAVLLDDCHLIGHLPPSATPWMHGGSALEVRNSGVFLSGCELRGANGFESSGGRALLATAGSNVHFARSELQGGGGGAHIGFYWWDIYCYSGAEAALLAGSELVVAGGPGNLMQGGQGYFIDTNNYCGGGAAVVLGNNGVLRYAADATLLRGPDGTGVVAGSPIFVGLAVTGASFVGESGVRPTLKLAPSAALPGQVVTVQASGEPNGAHFAFASIDGVAPIVLPASMRLHLDPSMSFLFALLPLSGAGIGQATLSLPPTPSLAGAHVILQSIDSNLSTIRLSNAALLVVLD